MACVVISNGFDEKRVCNYRVDVVAERVPFCLKALWDQPAGYSQQYLFMIARGACGR
ncbi:MAG TPA: hypothetical protein VI875_04420 [Candidatus Norongarragalinales archaeon]|nr:hypothetical protein [Candidatus Norongarragalinales archaeon]